MKKKYFTFPVFFLSIYFLIFSAKGCFYALFNIPLSINRTISDYCMALILQNVDMLVFFQSFCILFLLYLIHFTKRDWKFYGKDIFLFLLLSYLLYEYVFDALFQTLLTSEFEIAIERIREYNGMKSYPICFMDYFLIKFVFFFFCLFLLLIIFLWKSDLFFWKKIFWISFFYYIFAYHISPQILENLLQGYYYLLSIPNNDLAVALLNHYHINFCGCTPLPTPENCKNLEFSKDMVCTFSTNLKAHKLPPMGVPLPVKAIANGTQLGSAWGL